MQYSLLVQSKTLRFAYIDGTIQNICPTDGDEVWVLNIKRGILSALQITMETLQGVSDTQEIDVCGNCPVKYEVSLPGNLLLPPTGLFLNGRFLLPTSFVFPGSLLLPESLLLSGTILLSISLFSLEVSSIPVRSLLLTGLFLGIQN